MDVTGQAFEDMQEQNTRLLQQLREKDDANFKLMSEVWFSVGDILKLIWLVVVSFFCFRTTYFVNDCAIVALCIICETRSHLIFHVLSFSSYSLSVQKQTWNKLQEHTWPYKPIINTSQVNKQKFSTVICHQFPHIIHIIWCWNIQNCYDCITQNSKQIFAK